MAEYIEREALLNRITSLIKEITPIEENRDMFYHDSGWNGAITAARIAVKNAPSEDVAPVRHGRWLRFRDYNGDSILVCSECGRVCHEEDAPYCYCGAKMDLDVR